MPIEVLRHLFSNKSTHLFRAYIELTRNTLFSGHLDDSRMQEFASATGMTKKRASKHLEQLSALNLVNRFNTLWMAVGAKEFAIRVGKTRVKYVELPENATRNQVTTIAYALFISEEFNKKNYEQRSKITHDMSNGSRSLQLSCSYTRRHMGSFGIKRSIQTISTQRRRAKSSGLLEYSRQSHVKQLMVDGELCQMTGGDSVASLFSYHMEMGWVDGHEFLSKRGKTVTWLKEHPSSFSSVMPIYSRGMSASEKKRAVSYYLLYNSIR